MVDLLTKCSLRRGAATNGPQLAVYSADLVHYDLDVVAEALDTLGRTERMEGEAALPDCPNLVRRVRDVIRGRRIEKDKFDREQERINTRKHFEAHPEDYTTPSEFKEMIAPLVAKFGRTGEK